MALRRLSDVVCGRHGGYDAYCVYRDIGGREAEKRTGVEDSEWAALFGGGVAAGVDGYSCESFRQMRVEIGLG